MDEKLFNIGDVAWFARTGFQEIQEPCQVCFGNKSVTVILGNGDEVIVPCSCCASGYNAPSGLVTHYRIQPAAMAVTITGREIREGEKTEVTYHGSGGHFYYSHTLFESFAEALAASKELCEKELHDRENRAEWIKKDTTKSFAWNAGYHLREAQRLREQIAYHERMAVVCKSRTKEEK
jgi:hypothetical protein